MQSIRPISFDGGYGQFFFSSEKKSIRRKDVFNCNLFFLFFGLQIPVNFYFCDTRLKKWDQKMNLV